MVSGAKISRCQRGKVVGIYIFWKIAFVVLVLAL
jgi:hypothetical protein